VTFEKFQDSVSGGAATPPADIHGALAALWHDARGDWERAHEDAQDDPSAEGSWVHAYLHRKEGDLGNAAYWYRRANRPVTSGSISDEWERIARELLGRSRPSGA
jgi:hypothetical protein